MMNRIAGFFWIGFIVMLALGLAGSGIGYAASSIEAVVTSTRWPTATLRPTDTRWPSLTPTGGTRTPTRTPTASETPTSSRTPTQTRTPTTTYTPSLTRTSTSTPIGAVPAPVLLLPAEGELVENVRPRLDWDDVPGATLYSVVVSRYSTFAYPLVNRTVSVSEYSPISDLPRNAMLYWRVRVLLPKSSAWVTGTFNMPNPPYAPPLYSPASNALLTNYRPTLDWGPSTIPSGVTFSYYQVQVDDNQDFSSPLVEVQENDVNRHYYELSSDLPANTTFYWRVRTASNDGSAYSLWSSVRYFRTALVQPNLLSPVFLEVPNHLRPWLDWSDVPGANSYALVASIYPSFSSPFLFTSVKDSEYTPTVDFPRNKVIYWRVRALGDNPSAWSTNQFTTPQTIYTLAIYSPANGAVMGINPGLDWSAAYVPPGAAFGYYQLQVDDNIDFSSPVLDHTEADITHHWFAFSRDETLTPGTTYYWRVRAANSANQFSTWVSRWFKTFGPTITPGPSPTATPGSGAVVPNPLIRQITMINTGSGWGISNDHILRTFNGGVTWFDAGLPVSGISGYATQGFFRDMNLAWVLVGSNDFGSGVLYHTANGGATWNESDVPFGMAHLNFIDSANGFVLASLGGGAGREGIAIYQTTDGGKSWMLKFTNDPNASGSSNDIPLGGQKTGILFRDSLRGWVIGSRPESGFTFLYMTSDGGTTWVQQALPLPTGFDDGFASLHTPIFFTSADGILPVTFFTGVNDRTLFIYITHNGGVTWSLAKGSATLGWANLTDFTSFYDGISWTNGNFAVTRNAGASWSTVTPNISFPGEVTWLDFASATVGWVLATDDAGNSHLYKTADSGWTWTLVSSSAPTPTPTPTQTAAPSATSTPTITSTPAAYLGPFGVVEVASNDVLNIRSGPGVSYSISGSFPYNAVTVMSTGQTELVSGAIWTEVQHPLGGTGWVNSFYLTEYVVSEQFCVDSRVPALYQQLKNAINNSDGNALSALVSPKHGLNISFWHNSVRWYSKSQSANLFNDATEVDWGSGPSGTPTIGRFSIIVQPSLRELLNIPYELYCNQPKAAAMFFEPWPGSWTNYNYYALLKPGTPGVELDYLQWSAGIDFIDGQPYLVSLQRTVWEP